MKYNALDYEMPWRPNYEKQAVAGWLVAGWLAASAAAVVVNHYGLMPSGLFYWITGICCVMAMAQLPKAIRLANLQKHLRGRELEFISMKELQKTIKGHPTEMWVGSGFDWENRHTQRAFEILKRDHTEGHTLIVGTTGASKSRMFDILIYQAIMRGEAVIIHGDTGCASRGSWRTEEQESAEGRQEEADTSQSP